MVPMYFKTVYLTRMIQIESGRLGAFYFGGVLLVVIWSLVQCFVQHSYVVRPPTYLETAFWRYSAVDGSWWFGGPQPQYCGSRHRWGNDTGNGIWGSDAVTCRIPALERASLFYFDSNALRVATSVAYGNELNSTELFFYEHVEKVGIVFQTNFFNSRDTQEVQNCRAIDDRGNELKSRWAEVAALAGEPQEVIDKGYLMLTVEDILHGTGSSWDDSGNEHGSGMDKPLPFRLQGVEVVADIQVRNFHIPFDMTNTTECIIRFQVFRNQFTAVHHFYDRDQLMGIQHGLKLKVTGSANLGYPCFTTGLQTFALGLAMVSCMDTLLTLVLTMFHPRREEINQAAYETLEFEHQRPRKTDERRRGQTRTEEDRRGKRRSKAE